MSRLGNKPIELNDVEFSMNGDNVVTLKGEKGSDTLQIDPRITVDQKDDKLVVSRNGDEQRDRSLHGLYHSLISNMVHGVKEGYEIEMEIIGVGFRAAYSGGVLELNIGFSHPVMFVPPEEVDIEVDRKKRKNPTVFVRGINKELVGQVAAKVRSFRPPEPYKGKGIRYVDEWVRRKAGKSAAKA